jgi:hypothetical protein
VCLVTHQSVANGRIKAFALWAKKEVYMADEVSVWFLKGAMAVASDIDLKAFSSYVRDNVLNIFIEKEFDFGSLHQDWAHFILARHPGPFAGVFLDLSKCGRVSSTFYAGLMQLHFSYNADGARPLILHKPDPRMLTNLKVLHLEKYFIFEV